MLHGLQNAASTFAGFSEETRLNMIHQIPDQAFLALGGEVDQALERAQLSDSPALKMLTSADSFNLSHETSEQMNAVLKNYFSSLDLEDRRRIFSGYLEAAPNADIDEQLASILNSTGPGMQKLFQLIREDANSPMLKEVLAALKKDIKPFDTDIARKMIEARMGRPISEVFTDFGEKPLAAATRRWGRCPEPRLKSTGQWVAIKVRRPGIKDIAEREITNIQRALSGSRAGQEVAEKLGESLRMEVDFRIEAKNVDTGEIYSDPKKGIYVASRVKEIPPYEDLLVTKFAAGKSGAAFGTEALGGSERARRHRTCFKSGLTWRFLDRDFSTEIYTQAITTSS